MTERIFTPDERKAYEAQAHKRGFKTLREYIRSLLELDAKQGTASVFEDVDDELDDPTESFPRAWADAMEGRTMTYEELRRRMEEDDH